MWWFVVCFGIENITKLETCSWCTSLKSLGFQLSRSLETSHQNWQIGCLTTLSDFAEFLFLFLIPGKWILKILLLSLGGSWALLWSYCLKFYQECIGNASGHEKLLDKFEHNAFSCILIMKYQKCPSNWFVAVAENSDASVWHSWCAETFNVVVLCDCSWEGSSYLKAWKIFLHTCFRK